MAALQNTVIELPPLDDASAELYNIIKRAPQKLPTRKNDIYVTRATAFHAQLARAQKLLDMGFAEIYIHGLGASITRAMNLALQLQERSVGGSSLELSVNTSTVELEDDLEPKLKDMPYKSQSRLNSAIHIKVSKTL